MLKILLQRGSILVISRVRAGLHECISRPLFILYEAMLEAHQAPHGIIKLLIHRYLLVRQ